MQMDVEINVCVGPRTLCSGIELVVRRRMTIRVHIHLGCCEKTKDFRAKRRCKTVLFFMNKNTQCILIVIVSQLKHLEN